MLPPEMYKQIVAESAALSAALKKHPNPEAQKTAADLDRQIGEFRTLSKEPLPEQIRPGYAENLQKQLDAKAAEIANKRAELENPPPVEDHFTPWNGKAIGADLALEFGLGSAVPVQTPPPASVDPHRIFADRAAASGSQYRPRTTTTRDPAPSDVGR